MLKKIYHCESGLQKCFTCHGKKNCQSFRMIEVDEEENNSHGSIEDDIELMEALKDLKKIFEFVDE